MTNIYFLFFLIYKKLPEKIPATAKTITMIPPVLPNTPVTAPVIADNALSLVSGDESPVSYEIVKGYAKLGQGKDLNSMY